MVGEHIRTRRDGRWTHAIDCGDATVIHLVQNGEVRVRRTYRPEFVAGADAVEVVTHRERTFAATEIVARAYSRLAASGLSGMFRDSEAFAEWCATGRLPLGRPNLAVGLSSGTSTDGKRPARAVAAPAKRAKPTKKPRGSAKRRAAPARRAAKRSAAPAGKSRKKAPERAARPKARAKGRRR